MPHGALLSSLSLLVVDVVEELPRSGARAPDRGHDGVMGLASRLVERVLGRRLFDDSSDGMVELEVTSPAAGAVLVAALEQMGLSVAAAECPGDREESDSRMRVLVRRDQYWVAVERLEHHR